MTSALVFNGISDYIQIPDDPAFSVTTTGELSVAAWMRPDVLTFPKFQSTGYVHWMGKGETGRQEWVFRMYNLETKDDPPRPNRISFYVFNPDGHQGIGSYFQEPVTPGVWIHVVGVVTKDTTSIYKNGEFKDCDRYTGTGTGRCHNYSPDRWITPERGTAPLRIGTRDLESFFLGSIREVRLWNRALSAHDVSSLFSGQVPEGVVAEYLLHYDVAVDTVRSHNGVIVGGQWSSE